MSVGGWSDAVSLLLGIVGLLSVSLGGMWKLHKAQQTAAIKAHESAELLATVKAQLIPNGGSSLRDSMDRQEKQLEEMKARQEAQHDDYITLAAHLEKLSRNCDIRHPQKRAPRFL